MGQIVVSGAGLTCSFGTVMSSLQVTSQMKCLSEGKPIATIKDMAGNVNIPPFGMCTSLANPQVASATAAALGVLTPQPCTVTAAGTWTASKPGVMIDGIPCLCNDAGLMCAMGAGNIAVAMPGQTKTVIG